MAKIKTTHGILCNKEVIVDEPETFWEDLLTPANFVTASGMLALVAALYPVMTDSMRWTVPLLFGYGAGLSDALDGYVAQISHKYSRIGRIGDAVRDRLTIVFLVVIMASTEADLLWVTLLPAVVLLELRIAYFNYELGEGSHAWGKRRYFVHLAAISQYVCQTYWDFWPVEVSAFLLTILMALGTIMALPEVYTKIDERLERLKC